MVLNNREERKLMKEINNKLNELENFELISIIQFMDRTFKK